MTVLYHTIREETHHANTSFKADSGEKRKPRAKTKRAFPLRRRKDLPTGN